jgi:polyhydroxybutyrate depolymerase
MRALFVPLMLVIACSTAEPLPNPEPLPAVCAGPVDGGVFVTGVDSPSPGCSAPPAPTGVIDLGDVGWVRVGGLLSVPPSAGGTPLPVVFVFHGAGGSGAEIREELTVEPAADGGAIFVYPNAAAGTWDIRSTSPDYRMVNNVLGRLSNDYCIDGQKVFLAGFSAGAVFALYVGCNAAPVFRAVGSVAGTVFRFDRRCCTGPISAVLVHGDADSAIPLDQGRSTRNYLLAEDGCGTSPVPDSPECVTYPGCAAGRAVDWCEHPGEHVVPSWAGAELWRFFAQFP